MPSYVSTMTYCQNLVAKEGIFGGPNKADDYAKRVGQPTFVKENPECEPIFPWSNVGKTVTNLLESGIIFPARTRQKMYKSSIRGWSLSDFWEQSTWPRDSSGSAQVRFGMPVVDDPDLDNLRMIAAAPYQTATRRIRSGGLSAYESFDFSAVEEDVDAPPKPVQDIPFIQQVAGVYGIQTEIMDPKLDCILFLSAKFCKTCKLISPQYIRMARISSEETQSNLVYAKVETSGKWGKEVGRYLGVDAVPNFILFRNGERFGTPLSVSKLPSKKIDQAIRLLESGAEWDPDVLRADEANS
jgi:Thioredoxin